MRERRCRQDVYSSGVYTAPPGLYTPLMTYGPEKPRQKESAFKYCS